MSTRAPNGQQWDRKNWCAWIITPPVPGIAPYQCFNNGIHDGLCNMHRRQQDKRDAKRARSL